MHISNLSEKRKKNKETSEAALCTVECDYCDISGAGTNIFPFIMKKSLVFKYGKLVFSKTIEVIPHRILRQMYNFCPVFRNICIKIYYSSILVIDGVILCYFYGRVVIVKMAENYYCAKGSDGETVV